jgi:hypothetical protein
VSRARREDARVEEARTRGRARSRCRTVGGRVPRAPVSWQQLAVALGASLLILMPPRVARADDHATSQAGAGRPAFARARAMPVSGVGGLLRLKQEIGDESFRIALKLSRVEPRARATPRFPDRSRARDRVARRRAVSGVLARNRSHPETYPRKRSAFRPSRPTSSGRSSRGGRSARADGGRRREPGSITRTGRTGTM